MMWRVRATVIDRPGVLAEIALACGEADVNILGMQVFSTTPAVTDEFVVRAPDGWTDVRLAALFESAGGSSVSVTRVRDDSIADTTTRHLHGVHQVLKEGRDLEAVLGELLETEPPDVADYTGHDVLVLQRRNGSEIRVSRAVPFTPIEHARAQALVSLVGDVDIEIPMTSSAASPAAHSPVPVVRTATLADVDAVSTMHERCSIDTLYLRYQVPLRVPMTGRMARRLVAPDAGQAIVIQAGPHIVGHGVLELIDTTWTFQLLVEDAWQGHGLGTMLVKNAAGRAKGEGAERLSFVTAGSNDKLLRAVGNAGFVARVERHDGNVHITVPLREVRSIQAS